ncbi:MAG: 50S ribosomal protein L13 [Firmicutes bacterium]|nr:50S ribosomal protein L13 [Alicyclobacillaceae bacterium]MCL6497853.1 50S ribosomal protein L13 [Bacillota bacterium]
MPTYMAKPSEVERKWYVIDAAGKPLGRVAALAATLLRGKHKPIYTPHIDTGDHVIIINASQVVLTGKKLDQKVYYHHSGYPGGLKQRGYRQLMATKPEFVLEHAVRGMLPKNRLGRKMFKKLKVYRGSEHPHAAQKPEPWEGLRY